MAISTTQARALLTQAVVDVYDEMPQVTSFLKSFFRESFSPTRFLKTETTRGFELRAKDISRGDDPNMNRVSKSSEKIFTPPMYGESIYLNEFDWYDYMVNIQGNIDAKTFGSWRDEIVTEVIKIRDKVERSYERQSAQALLDGVIVFDTGDQIDFKRKAASLTDKSGTPWTGANNPLDHIEEACQFIRKEGKYNGEMFDVIMGVDAFRAFRDNSDIQNISDNRRFSLGGLEVPRRNLGGDLHSNGYAAGAYNFRIWTYDQYYDDSSASTGLNYVDPKKIIVLPASPRFTFGYASVPKLMPMDQQIGLGLSRDDGRFCIQEYLDYRKANHEVSVKSTGAPLLTAVDQVVTYKVIA